ncbi:MAG TPA: MFS transporter [Solirubrobacteraceae bacterium]|nr:MFS transporter [Solirubrobacteraceae bacterium]
MEGERIEPAPLTPAILAGGVVLVAINLRPAAASIGPLLTRIQAGEHLSSTAAGALATLPVLCFGLLAPLAPALAQRFGLRRTIAGSMCVLAAGMLGRLAPGVGFLFAGTALAGCAIATANVLVPVLVRRDFRDRTGGAMALYTTALIAFAALAAGATVPLAQALGGGWRAGLGVWALPAGVAALAWAPALLSADVSGAGDRPGAPASIRPHSARSLMKSPLAWQVTLFFALQSAGFYATLAWLPTIFESHGDSAAHAGLLLSLTMIVGVVAAPVVPGLATRFGDQRWLAVTGCALTAAGLAGILVAPMAASYLWAVLLGLGQNAMFPLALMLIVLRGGSVQATEGLSTLAQSVGYVLAAAGPLAVGALHSLTGSWSGPVALLLALVVPQVAAGLAAGHGVLALG